MYILEQTQETVQFQRKAQECNLSAMNSLWVRSKFGGKGSLNPRRLIRNCPLLLNRIQLGQPVTVKVAANLVRLFSSNNKQLVAKAVSLATARDGASRGVVRTVIINSEAVTRNFYPGDTLPLWHEELEPQNSLLDILNSPTAEPMNI